MKENGGKLNQICLKPSSDESYDFLCIIAMLLWITVFQQCYIILIYFLLLFL